MIGHQVYLNASAYLSEYGQSDCGISHLETFKCGKICHSNSNIVTNFVLTLVPHCWFKNVLPDYFCTEVS
jgi:hypothetical protein